MKRLSGKEMTKLLRSLGWVLDRVRGAHYIYRHPDGREVPVPVHCNRTVSMRAQRVIMRSAGVFAEEL